jgi:tagatose 1,6-diphosphate aldolase
MMTTADLTPVLTPGKKRGLDAVSDARGVIAALAIDQRGAMRELFSKPLGKNPADVPGDSLVEYKKAVSRILTPYASAILLDPEFGLPASRERDKNSGLLLAYEITGYDKAVKGRLPRLLDHWSVQRLVREGADSIKLLLYYSSLSEPEINDIKYAFVERLGAECAAADVPFFLELVSYADGIDSKSPEFARKKPELVSNGMTEFTKPQYRIDILKVGMPVDLASVEGAPSPASQTVYSRKEAQQHFLHAAQQSTLPFIYLSEGVSNETFQFGLELAAESGAKFSGVLCGRATWKDGVAVRVEKGAAALDEWLRTVGKQNIENVNARLKAATPWHSIRSAAKSNAGAK